jgi:hypothetical protein
MITAVKPTPDTGVAFADAADEFRALEGLGVYLHDRP